MRLFPSAASRITFADACTALTQVGSPRVQSGFVSDITGCLNMTEGVALMSLMRNTYVVMAAIMRQHFNSAEVILPRYCCPSFIHGITAAGIAYRYCDLDTATLAMSPGHIEAVRTNQSTAVLVPNLFGLCADMSSLAQYCKANRLLLIDAADYTFGGVFAGRPLGSFGDFAILNFQEGKALPIGGGMALGRTAGSLRLDEHTTTDASSLVAFARTLAYLFLIRPLPYGLFSRGLKILGVQKKKFSMEDTIRATKQEFDFTVDQTALWQGISKYQSALGRTLLSSLNFQQASRWTNALVIEQELKGLPDIDLVPRHPNLDQCHYIRYPILVRSGRRDDLCAQLIEAGYEASPMYVEHGMQIDSTVFPGAARICDELLTLPCHPFMDRDDLEEMCLIIRNHRRA